MRLLVVSGHEVNHRLVEKAIGPEGFTYLKAMNELEALGLIADSVADALWIDTDGIRGTGNALARHVRAMCPGFLIILWTTSEVADMRNVNLMVTKPTSLNVFKETGVKLLEMHGG